MHREMHIVACAYIILERTRYTHNMSTLMDVVLHSVQVFCRAASEKRRSDATTKMQRRDNKKSDDAVMEEYGGGKRRTGCGGTTGLQNCASTLFRLLHKLGRRTFFELKFSTSAQNFE